MNSNFSYIYIFSISKFNNIYLLILFTAQYLSNHSTKSTIPSNQTSVVVYLRCIEFFNRSNDHVIAFHNYKRSLWREDQDRLCELRSSILPGILLRIIGQLVSMTGRASTTFCTRSRK